MEIDTAALKHNYSVFRSLISPAVRLMAVAKSNAYGHGLLEYVKIMETFGIDWFSVDSIAEALTLRTFGIIKPILVLGYTLPSRFGEAAAHNIHLTISAHENLRELLAISRNGPIPKIHLKIDTGMHRQGFMRSDIPSVLNLFKDNMPQLSASLDGVYTHFAAAKNPALLEETRQQMQIYEEVLDMFQNIGLGSIIRHAAATGGTLLFPDAHYDMVRIGIGLYGLWPSPETKVAWETKITLKPSLSWKTIISEVKALPKGSRIGYDFSETLLRDSKVAVCPIGYWHGYPRALSSIGKVLVNGVISKVLGKVSMDMITIDVTDVKNSAVGDIVTLLDTAVPEASADALEALSNTTSYEIITRLNPLMKRVYIH